MHEWRIRNQQGYARQQVFKRDKGVCAACGLDTEKERMDRWLTDRRVDHVMKRFDGTVWKIIYNPSWPDRKNRWQADHIVPVAEGGGQCGLDGLRTLCTACHLEESRNLVARLAEKRRAAKTLLDQPALPVSMAQY